MKKISILLIFILCICSIFTFNTSAAYEDNTYYDDAKAYTWKPQTVNTSVLNGMTYKEMYGITKKVGAEYEEKQHISYFEMKTDGVNSKLVTWTRPSGSKGYSLTPLTQLAKDFEANNPGWIVMGGINADMYVMNFGNDLPQSQFPFKWQDWRPMKYEGEARFPFSVTAFIDSEYRGIRNDGSKDGLIDPERPKGIRIEVLDENGNITYMHDVDKTNETPSSGEVSLWSSYYAGDNNNYYVEFDVNSSSKLYIVEKPDLAYVYNHPSWPAAQSIYGIQMFGFFGKGTVSKIDTKYHFGGYANNPDTYDSLNAFAIETSNTEVANKLANGTYIRVQYYWENEELNECESFLNCHTSQREDGKDIYSSQPYDQQQYSRSVWGQKADGTYILMTTAYGNDGKYYGTNQNETNAILASLGVVDAFQQDGGGSVMAIVRNQNGDFDLVHPSRDGDGRGQRSILCGAFFVVRDTGIRLNASASDYHQVILTKTGKIDYTDAKVYATVDGKKHEIVNDSIVIGGLKPETTYDIKVSLEKNDGTVITNELKYTTKSYVFPNNLLQVDSIGKNSITFKPKNEFVKDAYVSIEDVDYKLDDNNLISVTDLNTDFEYNYTYHVTYFDEDSGLTLEYDSEELKFKTRAFNEPKVTLEIIDEKCNLDNGDIAVKAVIEDPDKIVSNLKFLLDGIEFGSVETKKKTKGEYEFVFDGLSIGNKYKLSAQSDYLYDKGEEPVEGTVNSTTIEFNLELPCEPEPIIGGCGSSASVVIYMITSLTILSSLLFVKKH